MKAAQNTKTLAAALILILTASAGAESKYQRSQPFTVDYSTGRTHRTSYKNDPNTAAKLGMSIEAKCTPTKTHDFDTRGFGPALSRQYFTDPQFADFQVIVLVSIPLQKLFVLDRRAYDSGRDGLVYAWKTSTGYHDKHFAYSRREEKVVFGQKSTVQIFHPTRESALKKLRSLAQSAGAKLNDGGGRPFVTYANSPTKKVEFSENNSKISRAKAEAQGVEIVGEDPNTPGFVTVRRYVLNYSDYFHTEPGYFVVQNGFSSKHISGESDGAVDSEEPLMPWAMFFNIKRGMATHAAAYRGTLGSPNSHGCVRLLEENACRLFHLVGQTERASVAALNEKSGVRTGKSIDAYRAIYVVSETLSPAEQQYQGQLR